MRRIRFTRLLISPLYGNCGEGQILDCSESFAKHAVGLGAAVYVDNQKETTGTEDSSRDKDNRRNRSRRRADNRGRRKDSSSPPGK